MELHQDHIQAISKGYKLILGIVAFLFDLFMRTNEAIEYGDCISLSVTEAKLRAIIHAKKKCGVPVLRVSKWERFQRPIYCINEGVRAEFQCVFYQNN